MSGIIESAQVVWRDDTDRQSASGNKRRCVDKYRLAIREKPTEADRSQTIEERRSQISELEVIHRLLRARKVC